MSLHTHITSYQEEIRLQKLFERLSKSRFRNSFHIDAANYKQLQLGIHLVLPGTREIVQKKIGAVFPKKDGSQTPFRASHPAFVAMHHVSACCRSCLETWHFIKKGKELSDTQLDYITRVIGRWFEQEMERFMKIGTQHK